MLILCSRESLSLPPSYPLAVCPFVARWVGCYFWFPLSQAVCGSQSGCPVFCACLSVCLSRASPLRKSTPRARNSLAGSPQSQSLATKRDSTSEKPESKVAPNRSISLNSTQLNSRAHQTNSEILSRRTNSAICLAGWLAGISYVTTVAVNQLYQTWRASLGLSIFSM